MKKFKIGNRVIKADHIADALRINKMLDSKVKDSLSSYEKDLCDYMLEKVYEKGMTANDLHKKMMSYYSEYSRLAREKRNEVLDYFEEEIDKGIYDSVKDDDVEYLSEEERQAIDDYKKAIANTTDPKLLRLFSHILKEEIEHLEELENEDVEDETIHDDRLSPMTYKKLKELGVKPEQWQKWTQEEANRFIAGKEKSSEKNSSTKEEQNSVEKKKVEERLKEHALQSVSETLNPRFGAENIRSSFNATKKASYLQYRGIYGEMPDDEAKIKIDEICKTAYDQHLSNKLEKLREKWDYYDDHNNPEKAIQIAKQIDDLQNELNYLRKQK